jgi:hypothetical protein
LKSKSTGLLNYEFSPATLQELRHLLGNRLDAALPILMAAANFYSDGQPFSNVAASVRNEIARVIALVEKTEVAIKRLSPGARQLLHHTTDYDASLGAKEWISVDYTLSRLAVVCERVRLASKDALVRPINSPGMVLAVGVAYALAHAEVPLSKGREGKVARVLEVVWYALAPDRDPQRLMPDLRAAVNMVLSENPKLKARRGRPRK